MTKTAQRWADFMSKGGSHPQDVSERAFQSLWLSFELGLGEFVVPARLDLNTWPDVRPPEELGLVQDSDQLVVLHPTCLVGSIGSEDAAWASLLAEKGLGAYLLHGERRKLFVGFTGIRGALEDYRFHKNGSSANGTAEDVILWRDIQGRAYASVDHVVRHSPTGIEWGYGGSGPSDLAYSILCRFTGEGKARRHYLSFKEEVIAKVPKAGGRIPARFVQQWLSRQPA